MTHRSRLSVAALVSTLAGCGSGGGGLTTPADGSVPTNDGSVPTTDGSVPTNDGPAITIGDAGVPVTLVPSAAQTSALTAVTEKLVPAKAMTAETLAAARAVPFAATLGYDPKTAVNLSLVQASHLKLTDAELAVLAKNGFVISYQKRYPGFVYGYASIYADDLPVYVSADSIMHAVHRSYDEILKAVEVERLVPDLGTVLDAMRARLALRTDGFGATTVKDIDLYLAVAKALLTDTSPTLVAGGDASLAGKIVTSAKTATPPDDLELFGVKAHYDFSQFKPRGHYVGTPALERYFRAMIWLGRTELPIIAVDEMTGQTRFVRRALDGAVALRRLMDDASFARWKLIDATLRAFVGEPDSMSPPEIDRLLADLGVADLAALAALPDATVAQKIVDGAYGKQAISSQIIINGTGGTLPLSAVYLFLGQRYVVDSHVFSNVVFDRVAHPNAPPRMLPNPLDVAYAALKNDQAVSLLKPDLAKYAYAPDLEAMRVLVDQYDATFWGANLYNEWLGALRALSPGADLADMKSGLPAVARGEAWGRRILNAQLASWAELRRDTILYAKQSYSGGVTCEFPDAYVEPYPAFFAGIESFAAKGAALADVLTAGSTSPALANVKTYFLHLADVGRILREMAEHQRTGMPHSAAHLAFINEAVTIQTIGCGSKSAVGWYPKLFFNGLKSLEFDPTIADVHTAPTDEAGNPTGWVLHVATAEPRLAVVTIDTCSGPRAYAGLVSAYHEKVTEKFQRLNDQDWSAAISQTPPPDVAWMQDLVVR